MSQIHNLSSYLFAVTIYITFILLKIKQPVSLQPLPFNHFLALKSYSYIIHQTYFISSIPLLQNPKPP